MNHSLRAESSEPTDEQQTGNNEEYLSFLPLVANRYTPPVWEPIAFRGQNVTDLYLDSTDSNHVYASVFFAGLFETADGGHFWIQQQQPINMRINDIAVHPITSTTMYLATWSAYSVYWTEDGGDFWEPIAGWADLYPTLYSVAVHPLSPTTLFVGSGNWEPVGGQIFKTNNSGQDWYSVTPEFANAFTFAFHPISPTIIYAGTLGGVRKSIDGGESWFHTNAGLPPNAWYATSLILHPEEPDTIYVATSVGVYVSYDAAENWQPLFEGVEAKDLLFHPDKPDTLYLATTNGIFRSYNAGLNWTLIGGCGVGVFVNRLALDHADNHILWAATRDGLWQCLIP